MTDVLWAPWRLDYIKTVADGPKECFLCNCSKAPEQDAAHLVLRRTPTCLLMMNRYPYVNGHLLVAPYRHVPQLGDLEPQERADIMELLVQGQGLLDQVMNPQGYNIGINIGRCAGAGVPGHVHAHVVPRWSGDINFMSVVGNVRIIPQALEETFRGLQAVATKR